MTYVVPTVNKTWSFIEAMPSAGNVVLWKQTNSSSQSTGTSQTQSTGNGSLPVSGDFVVGISAAKSADTFVGDSDTTNGSWSVGQNVTAGAGQSQISQYKTVTASGSQTYDVTLTSASVVNAISLFSEAPNKTRTSDSNIGSESTTTIPFIRPLSAGSLGVLCVAADNTGSGGAAQNLPAGPLTDTQGNTWTSRQTAEGDNTINADTDTVNGSWSSQARSLAGPIGRSGMSISAQYKKVTAAGTQTFDPTLNATQDIIYGWIEVTAPAVSSAESYLHFLDFFP